MAPGAPLLIGATVGGGDQHEDRENSGDHADKGGDNGRFLVRTDGVPVFCLLETAWELLHRLSKEAGEF
jgi:hypothetical protein